MNIKNKKTIVIKIGTTSLIDEGKLSQTLLHSLAEKIKQHQNTHNFVIVTSGAVSLGGMELNYKTRPKSMKKLQVASAVCLLYTSPSPRDGLLSRMPSSA